jgi:hypothetical protein
MWGVEVDMNNIGTDAATSAGNAGGVSVSGASTMQAPGTFAAFLAFPAGIFATPNIKWKNAFVSSSGAADNGITLFPREPTGASSSQDILFYGNDGTNLHAGSLGTDFSGTLQLRGAFDEVEVLGGTNSILQVTGTNAAFLRLNTPSGSPNAKMFDVVNQGGSTNFLALNDDLSVKAIYWHMDANGGSTVGASSAPPPGTAMQVAAGKYFQASQSTSGAPPGGDCDAANELGRLSIDTTGGAFKLYVCLGAAGWKSAALS